jgi:hypothetical protein
VPDRESFLRRVDERLPFITEQRDAVLEELRGHLDESVAGLIDDGWDPVGAEEEALRRMGDPDELARHIGRAQQTRRRLLAAAGAGVLNTGSSMLLSVAMVLPPLMVAFALIALVSGLVGRADLSLLRSDNGMYLAALMWITAWLIGQRLPVALARASRRPVAWGRKVATASLVPFLVVWVVAVAQAQHSWLSIPAFLVTPVVAWVAIRRSGETMQAFSIGRGWAVVGLLVFAGLLLDGLGPPSNGEWLDDPYWADELDPVAAHLGLAGSLDLLDTEDRPRLGWSHGGREFHVRAGVGPERATRFPDLVVEIWPARPDLSGLDSRATGPLISAPLVPGEPLDHAMSLEFLGGQFLLFPQQRERPGELREQANATLSTATRLDWGSGVGWMVLVSNDADGHRHVVDWMSVDLRLAFIGSILEWLAADRSPAPIAAG